MLPVLMYHGLHASSDDRGRYDPVYSVRPDDFGRQLDWLLEQGYCGVRLDQVDASQRQGKRPVVITFDDGDVSNVEVALPMLLERGMTAEFFITSDFIGQAGMLSAEGVRALSAAGMGVGSHGRSHAFLEDVSPDELYAELHESRQALQGITGQAITSLALPGGRGGERERRVATALGYVDLLGSVPGPNRHRRRGQWYQRLAITRDMNLEQYADYVRWQGPRRMWLQARFHGLALPKRILGNQRYERLRARLL